MEEKKDLKEIVACKISNIDALKIKYKKSKISKLDANENPSIVKFNTRRLNKTLKKVNYYPDNDCMELRGELSRRLKIDKNNFLFGNGSSEIISLIIKACIEKGDKVITPVPTFLPYITESKIAGAIVEDVREFINQFDNLCVIRTFSKAYGLAGARIGYLISNSRIVKIVEKAKLPVNLSSVSEMLALEVLKDKKYLNETIEKNEIAKKKLYKNLIKLDIEFIPTYTNFVMIKKNKKIDGIYEKLIDNGIVVGRNFKNMEDFLRVTIGNKKDMKKLIV